MVEIDNATYQCPECGSEISVYHVGPWFYPRNLHDFAQCMTKGCYIYEEMKIHIYDHHTGEHIGAY